MSTQTAKVVEPGILTTIQDRGRYGYQRFGVPVSGAMDAVALRAGNILVGNTEEAAGLEMTVLGPRIRFLSETRIVVTGADLSPVLDGEAFPMWQAVTVSEGSVLAFNGPRDGIRSYLALAGGIDVPIVMGSRSTYLKGALGGLDGRALRAEDVLSTLPQEVGDGPEDRIFPDHLTAPFRERGSVIRVVLGPQHEAFTQAGIASFLGARYTVSIQSDRMGYRLEGPQIEHRSRSDIVSDGIPLGAVQVPGDGHPIVLLVDRGTTGGYAKIATVISVDIGKIAQAMPGDLLTFESVTVEEAHELLRRQEQALIAARDYVAGFDPAGRLNIVVDDEPVEVRDEAGHTIAGPEIVGEPGVGQSRHISATVEGNTYDFDVEVQERH